MFSVPLTGQFPHAPLPNAGHRQGDLTLAPESGLSWSLMFDIASHRHGRTYGLRNLGCPGLSKAFADVDGIRWARRDEKAKLRKAPTPLDTWLHCNFLGGESLDIPVVNLQPAFRSIAYLAK